MLHGLLGNAQSWVLTGPLLQYGKAIPYQIVDTNEYDVWLINFRGTLLSREHMKLNPDSDKEFWNYSFEEFGKYDLKDCLEFIQKEKNDLSKISVIGYSEGSATGLYAFSENPDYFD